VWTLRWGDHHLPWPDGPGHLYSLWRIAHRHDGDRLVIYVAGHPGHAQLIDLNSGEPIRVPFGSPDWIAAETRKASAADLPDSLRDVWPLDERPGEGGGVATPWLLAHINADYIALRDLRARRIVTAADHEREFMWAVLAADGSRHCLDTEIRDRVASGRWQTSDVDTLLALHAHAAERIRAERPSADIAAQLRLGF
jgi:hypothetical protein